MTEKNKEYLAVAIGSLIGSSLVWGIALIILKIVGCV